MTKEQKSRLEGLWSKMGVFGCPSDLTPGEREEFYELRDLEEQEYRKNNIRPLNEYYNKHIKGKTRETVDPDEWGCYSDWYKDVWGVRPHL